MSEINKNNSSPENGEYVGRYEKRPDNPAASSGNPRPLKPLKPLKRQVQHHQLLRQKNLVSVNRLRMLREQSLHDLPDRLYAGLMHRSVRKRRSQPLKRKLHVREQ